MYGNWVDLSGTVRPKGLYPQTRSLNLNITQNAIAILGDDAWLVISSATNSSVTVASGILLTYQSPHPAHFRVVLVRDNHGNYGPWPDHRHASRHRLDVRRWCGGQCLLKCGCPIG